MLEFQDKTGKTGDLLPKSSDIPDLSFCPEGKPPQPMRMLEVCKSHRRRDGLGVWIMPSGVSQS